MQIGAHWSDSPEMAIQTAQTTVKGGYAVSAIQTFAGQTNQFFPTESEPGKWQYVNHVLAHEDFVMAIHGPYTMNVCSQEKMNLYMASIKSVVAYMQAADKIGAKFVVFHPGAHKGAGMEAGLSTLRWSTNEILNQAMQKGIRCKLLWENTAGGGTQVGKAPLLAQLIREINHPQLGMCLDTTHSWADGHDLKDDSYRADFWASLKDVVKWVHFNMPDPNVELGSHRDRHSVSWKDGKWPVDTMVAIAREWGDHCPLVMEADEDVYDVNLMYLEGEGLI